MEKKFYYTDGKEKFGPYTVEELKQFNLTVDTLVWAEGMGDWVPAGKVAELQSLFPFDPPQIPNGADDPFQDKNTYANSGYAAQGAYGGQGYTQPNQQQMGPKPKNWLVESILVLLFCCWPLAIPGIVQASKVDSRYNAGDYNGSLEASENAKKWVLASFIVGLVILVIYVIIIASGALDRGPSYYYY